MGRRGPIAAPAHLRLANGSRPGRDSGGRRVSQPRNMFGEPPEKPDDLSAKASQHWDAVVEELEQAGTLQRSHGPLLVMLCEAWATWCNRQAQIAKVGRVSKRPSGLLDVNVLVRDQREAGREYVRLARELQLTPDAAQRVAGGSGSGDGGNPFSWGS